MTLHVPSLTTDTAASSRESISPGNARSGPYRAFFKPVFDITLVMISLPVILPVVLFLAVLIAATGNMPFYSQLRVGRGGTSFRMWKLRTMVKDADAHLEAHLSKNPAARAEWDATQKLKNDPRITPFGRLLRKTSIDELPQLLNVLNGTMSLVGPRPMMVNQKRFYSGTAYYHLRPGITGSWQVSDRNDCSFAERAAFDDSYGRKVSLKYDFRILVRTISVVCHATGH